MAEERHVLAVDFGTSNSAAGWMEGGAPRLASWDGGAKTLPTTFFFDFDSRKTLIGEPANAALLDGATGRFMRALKRVLGTGLMHEKRQIMNEKVTFVDIIARFLARLKTQAEAESGRVFRQALSGRPVVFHGPDDPREAQAEADLRACYLAAGFEEVAFLPEPEAAAIASGAEGRAGAVGLIVDIGGGTSDFSLFRTTAAGVEILANHGVRVGGTDFDRAVAIDWVMPHLGKGARVRNPMGGGIGQAPNAIFNDLATWEKIPFLYTAQNRRLATDLARYGEAPEKFSRLATVLEHELGHDLAFAVEAGKIVANAGDGAAIRLDRIERDLSIPLAVAALQASLNADKERLSVGAAETLRRAGVTAGMVDDVVYVGGSSLMAMVGDAMRALFPDARHVQSEVFTAVTDGLVLSSSRI